MSECAVCGHKADFKLKNTGDWLCARCRKNYTTVVGEGLTISREGLVHRLKVLADAAPNPSVNVVSNPAAVNKAWVKMAKGTGVKLTMKKGYKGENFIVFSKGGKSFQVAVGWIKSAPSPEGMVANYAEKFDEHYPDFHKYDQPGQNPEGEGSNFDHHRQAPPQCFAVDSYRTVPLEHTEYPESGRYMVKGALAVTGRLKKGCKAKWGIPGKRVKFRAWGIQSILTPKAAGLKVTAKERALENPEKHYLVPTENAKKFGTRFHALSEYVKKKGAAGAKAAGAAIKAGAKKAAPHVKAGAIYAGGVAKRAVKKGVEYTGRVAEAAVTGIEAGARAAKAGSIMAEKAAAGAENPACPKCGGEQKEVTWRGRKMLECPECGWMAIPPKGNPISDVEAPTIIRDFFSSRKRKDVVTDKEMNEWLRKFGNDRPIMQKALKELKSEEYIRHSKGHWTWVILPEKGVVVWNPKPMSIKAIKDKLWRYLYEINEARRKAGYAGTRKWTEEDEEVAAEPLKTFWEMLTPEEQNEVQQDKNYQYIKLQIYGTMTPGEPEKSPAENPRFEYRTVNTRTVEGLKEAERLKAAGWKIISSGTETIQFERPTSKNPVTMSLPIEQAVYVPSTKDGNKPITQRGFEMRVQETKKFLSKLYGGHTSTRAEGGYYSDKKKKMIHEKVVRVASFTTREAYKEKKPLLDAWLTKMAKEWGQESIGYEVEGDLMYVNPAYCPRCGDRWSGDDECDNCNYPEEAAAKEWGDWCPECGGKTVGEQECPECGLTREEVENPRKVYEVEGDLMYVNPEVYVRTMAERHGIPVGTRGILLGYERGKAIVKFPDYYDRIFKYGTREIMGEKNPRQFDNVWSPSGEDEWVWSQGGWDAIVKKEGEKWTWEVQDDSASEIDRGTADTKDDAQNAAADAVIEAGFEEGGEEDEEENPRKVYEVRGYSKLVTEDSYEHGEIGKSSEMGDDRMNVSAPTQEALIKKLMEVAGVNDLSAVTINAAEEQGRVDIQSLENSNLYPASENEIARWKKGEMKLWSAYYMFNVEVVKRKPAKLRPMAGANPTKPAKTGGRHWTPKEKKAVMKTKEFKQWRAAQHRKAPKQGWFHAFMSDVGHEADIRGKVWKAPTKESDKSQEPPIDVTSKRRYYHHIGELAKAEQNAPILHRSEEEVRMFEKEKTEHPKLTDDQIWTIVDDHKRKAVKRNPSHVLPGDEFGTGW